MKAPIHSQKHYVQITRSTVLTVQANSENLIWSVQSTVANLENEVSEGSLVKAVYVELWLLNSSNDGSDIVVLCKNSDSGGGPSYTNMQSLFTYGEKKNILFTHQGLSSNNGVGNPINVMRAWYKIPKSKQRFGLGDRLNLVIANNGPSTLEYCGFATYKEYS